MDRGNAYQIIATMAYTQVKYLIEQTVASGLIYFDSHSSDFKTDEIHPISIVICVAPTATKPRSA